MRLGPDHLERLAPEIVRPAYDRKRHGIGVVHLGIGAFHRAHQAVYFDDVLGREGGDWRILGVSLRSGEIRDRLVPQDGLYTATERDPAVDRRRVIGSVAGVLVAPEDPAAAIAALARPTVRIVSLTVTEKGYCLDPATGGLDAKHPDIVHDLACPETPRSAPGLLLAGLARRRASGVAAPTLLSCDNLPANGAALQRVLVELAASRDPALADWIDEHIACPSTVVDRIVPATTAADLDATEAVLGTRDEGAVITESFRQWVVEDRFANARPDLAEVGVRLVDDVRPFELAKLRMLNGAHSVLAYLGLLAGFIYVHEVVAEPDFARLIRRLMLDEVAPTLPAAPGLEPTVYADALLARFASPALQHRLTQIAADGSQKLPQRLVGTVRDNLSAGRSFELVAFGIAAWLRYVMASGESGAPHRLDDPWADQLSAIVARGRDPVAIAAGLLEFRPVFGCIGSVEPVRAAVVRLLRDLVERGTHEAVAKLLRRTD